MSEESVGNVEVVAAEPQVEQSVAAPVATENGEPDFDKMSLEELRSYIAAAESRGVPENGQPQAEEVKEESAAATTATAEGGQAEDVSSFEISKDFPLEEFEKKAQEYLESVEIPQPLQVIIDRLQEEAKKSREVSVAGLLGDEDVEVAKKVIDSFKRVVSFKQNEAGEIVPDTDGLKELFTQDFQKELPYVLRDLNSLPSTKYQGYTVFQEFIRDYAGLDDMGMLNLQFVLESGGKLPIPNYLPEGLHPQYSEAYWQSPDREQINEAVQEVMDVLKDPAASDYEKQVAEQRLAGIQQRLYQVQMGINAMKQQSEMAKQAASKTQEAVTETATKNYIDTTKNLLESFTTEIASYLGEVFDETGAPLAALGVARLAEAAVAGDEFSAIARQKLLDMGIKYDWNKAAGVIDRLWQSEQKIAKLSLEGANPLALKIAKDEKAAILKEIKRYEKELAGQVTKMLVESHSKRLKKKAAAVAKPAVVKSKVRGATGTTTPPKMDYDNMSLEELRARIGELRHSLRKEGIAAY